MALEVEIQRQLKDFSLDISFCAQPGCLGILGASGCGKSMTLKSIAGIETPDRGRIVLDGRVLFDSQKKINLSPQRRRVGYLFQNYALFPNMTVEENIAAGLRVPPGERRERVGRMVERFRLEGLEQRRPTQLSGGQQQRVALARSLAYEPEVLLLDEPFSALDAYLKEELQLELADILRDYGGIAIMVTHNRDEVYRLSQNLMIFHQGRKISMGDTRETFRSPQNLQAARLTGCKNFSRAQKTGENTLLALDWGVTLVADREVPRDLTSVGVRAHDFFPAQPGTENLIPVAKPRISESPFECNVIFTVGEGGSIWWKTEKELWSAADPGALPTALAVDPRHLLLLTGNWD